MTLDGQFLLFGFLFLMGVYLAAVVTRRGTVRSGYRPKKPKGPIVPPKGNAHSATPAPPREIIVTIKK